VTGGYPRVSAGTRGVWSCAACAPLGFGGSKPGAAPAPAGVLVRGGLPGVFRNMKNAALKTSLMLVKELVEDL